MNKIKISDKKEISGFLENLKFDFSAGKYENCIYKNKTYVSDKYLNFLNTDDGVDINRQLKYMLRTTYDECERIYPYLGDIFLKNIITENKKVNKVKNFRFTKKHKDDFLRTLKIETIKNIANWFFDNCSIERSVSVDYVKTDKVTLSLQNNVNFFIEYDCDFLINSHKYVMKNYNFIVIDGFIESVGEIHHALHKSANEKESFVIFCFGMSEEVKKTIITNNSKGITEIFPVVIKFDENTVNVLNDLAVIHDCDVISALKGQTISQEIRNISTSKKGKNIQFFKNKIVIDPLCTKEKIISHKKYLKNKIDKLKDTDVNTDVILNRIKNFSSKILKIYIPEELEKNISFSREINYLMFFLKNLGQVMKKINFDKEVSYYVPSVYLKILENKVNSLEKVYNNIEKAVLHRGEL